MVFPHAGENHRDGISNEKTYVEFMNSNPINDINQEIKKNSSINNTTVLYYSHVGGTQTKTDCRINEYNINFSIKNHKQGTFDWINTTKYISTELRENIRKYKNENMDKPINSIIRRDVSNILSDFLNELKSDNIKQILKDIYKTYPDWIVINDIRTKTYNLIHKEYLKFYFMSENVYFLKSTRATTSKQIWMIDANGNEINTYLRLRIVLNNGVNALLGQSSKNKTSVPCVKIQQDNVQLFLKNSENKIKVSY